MRQIKIGDKFNELTVVSKSDEKLHKQEAEKEYYQPYVDKAKQKDDEK